LAKGGVMSGDDVKQGQLNPSAIGPADMARLLSAAVGARIDEERIHEDIDAGAPTNIDGTMNLVHYAAWLVRQLATRGGGLRGGD
jgi:hypothetical protein